MFTLILLTEVTMSLAISASDKPILIYFKNTAQQQGLHETNKGN